MQDVNLRFWKSGTVIATAEAQYFHPDSCEKLKWPLVSFTSIYSSLSWSKFKSKDSFEKLRMSRFQNWPCFLNFVKIWWRYCQKQNWEIFRTTLYISIWIRKWNLPNVFWYSVFGSAWNGNWLVGISK